jgi:hypothetical protein
LRSPICPRGDSTSERTARAHPLRDLLVAPGSLVDEIRTRPFERRGGWRDVNAAQHQRSMRRVGGTRSSWSPEDLHLLVTSRSAFASRLRGPHGPPRHARRTRQRPNRSRGVPRSTEARG